MLDGDLIKQISSIKDLGKISEIKLEKPGKSGGRKFSVVIEGITFQHVTMKDLVKHVNGVVKNDLPTADKVEDVEKLHTFVKKLHASNLNKISLKEHGPLAWALTKLRQISNLSQSVIGKSIKKSIDGLTQSTSQQYCNVKNAEEAAKKLAKEIAAKEASIPKKVGIQPYSVLGTEALQFARNLLKERPDIIPIELEARGGVEMHKPLNKDIPLLWNLYFDLDNKLDRLLEKKQKDGVENPWADEEVIQAADTLMKVSFAVSNLTLDDLIPYTERLSKTGDKRTIEEALTRQDSYHYKTFFPCATAYHTLRGCYTWHEEIKMPWTENYDAPKDHVKPYYLEGTIQHSWNQLYNEYSKRARVYADEATLRKADQRYIVWTPTDEQGKAFNPYPSTQPT